MSPSSYTQVRIKRRKKEEPSIFWSNHSNHIKIFYLFKSMQNEQKIYEFRTHSTMHKSRIIKVTLCYPHFIILHFFFNLPSKISISIIQLSHQVLTYHGFTLFQVFSHILPFEDRWCLTLAILFYGCSVKLSYLPYSGRY